MYVHVHVHEADTNEYKCEIFKTLYQNKMNLLIDISGAVNTSVEGIIFTHPWNNNIKL